MLCRGLRRLLVVRQHSGHRAGKVKGQDAVLLDRRLPQLLLILLLGSR